MCVCVCDVYISIVYFFDTDNNHVKPRWAECLSHAVGLAFYLLSLGTGFS